MDNARCPIAQNAQEHPSKIAVITDSKQYAYKELDQIVTDLKEQLEQQQIGPGSRVAFVATTSVRMVALFFALFRLNATACPLSHRIPSSQVEMLMQQLGASHLLDLHRLHQEIVTTEGTEPTEKEGIRGNISLAPSSSVSSVPSVVKNLPKPWNSESIATCLFTSGSSGTPKIACQTLNNHIFNAL